MTGCGNGRSSAPAATSRFTACGLSTSYLVVIHAPASRAQACTIAIVPLGKIDQKMRLRAAFPPTGIVVVLGDLDEAEFLVVVGADPFGGIDGALFERRKDIPGRKLLRHDTELAQN